MLVCHCNVVTEAEIVAAITAFLDDDPWQIIVPAKLFRALEKRGRCCACFPNVVDLIVKVTTEYHRHLETPDERLRDLRHQLARLDARTERKNHARRRSCHRTTERGPVSRTGRSEPVLGAFPAS